MVGGCGSYGRLVRSILFCNHLCFATFYPGSQYLEELLVKIGKIGKYRDYNATTLQLTLVEAGGSMIYMYVCMREGPLLWS